MFFLQDNRLQRKYYKNWLQSGNLDISIALRINFGPENFLLTLRPIKLVKNMVKQDFSILF